MERRDLVGLYGLRMPVPSPLPEPSLSDELTSLDKSEIIKGIVAIEEIRDKMTVPTMNIAQVTADELEALRRTGRAPESVKFREGYVNYYHRAPSRKSIRFRKIKELLGPRLNREISEDSKDREVSCYEAAFSHNTSQVRVNILANYYFQGEDTETDLANLRLDFCDPEEFKYTSSHYARLAWDLPAFHFGGSGVWIKQIPALALTWTDTQRDRLIGILPKDATMLRDLILEMPSGEFVERMVRLDLASHRIATNWHHSNDAYFSAKYCPTNRHFDCSYEPVRNRQAAEWLEGTKVLGLSQMSLEQYEQVLAGMVGLIHPAIVPV